MYLWWSEGALEVFDDYKGRGACVDIITVCSLGFCCCSVTKSCLTICDPFNCRTPVFPILHYLSEFAQTHVHWVIDAIQPSEPLSPPSPPALSLSQHQSFKWVDCSHQVAKVLELQLQHQSFPWIFRVDFLLGLTGFILDFFFLCSFIFVFREHMPPPPNTAILKLLWSYYYLLTSTPVWTTVTLERLSLESGQRRNMKKDSFIHSTNDIESLLCARLFRCWNIAMNQTEKLPDLTKLKF